jgi:hypothetical protein
MLKEGTKEDRIRRLMAISAMGGAPLSYEAAASAIEAGDSGKFKGGRTEKFIKMLSSRPPEPAYHLKSSANNIAKDSDA